MVPEGHTSLVGIYIVKIKLRFSVGLCVHYRTRLILSGGRWRNSEVPLERGGCSPVGSFRRLLVLSVHRPEWYTSLQEAQNIDLHAAPSRAVFNSRSTVLVHQVLILPEASKVHPRASRERLALIKEILKEKSISRKYRCLVKFRASRGNYVILLHIVVQRLKRAVSKRRNILIGCERNVVK